MTTDTVLDLSDDVERRAMLAVAMSEDPAEAQLALVRRRNHNIVTVMATVALLLSIHDLALLVRLGS